MSGNSRLIYLVGPSGVGKDSVLTQLKRHHYSDNQPLVAHRYITRPARADDENHIELTEFDFNRRLKSNLFLFHWQSHDYSYAVGVEIKKWLQQGHCVIINGSRQYLEQARQIFPGLMLVWMTVSEDVLRQRLQHRGRENAEEIEARIQRSKKIAVMQADDYLTIYNDRSIEDTVEKLLALVESTRT